jgi:hypothetical protein
VKIHQKYRGKTLSSHGEDVRADQEPLAFAQWRLKIVRISRHQGEMAVNALKAFGDRVSRGCGARDKAHRKD